MAKKKSAKKRQNISTERESSSKSGKTAKEQEKVVKSNKKPVSKKTKKKVTSSKKGGKDKKIIPTGKKKVSKKKSARGSSRYRTIQKILSDYTKEQGIKLGKGFNKAVSELYRRTKGQPLKFVEQNIDVLYSDYLGQATVVQQFPDGFPFYQFMDTVAMPIFDKVQIGVSFQDAQESFDYQGTAFDVQSWYSSNLHPYLRQNYNESPTAYFQIIDTDNKTYVRYQVVAGQMGAGVSPAAISDEEIEEKEQKAPAKPKKEEKAPAAEKEVEIEREKQQTIQKQIELEASKQKSLEKEIELTKEKQKANAEKMKQIKELREMGFSNDEIKGMLS